MMAALAQRQPELRRPFDNSIFPACTVNFGPNVATVPHLDFNNDPALMCLIQSLGNFDPKLGGHLVLWDLKLVIEFPPGSTICIPSSLLSHSNLPIRAGETRASFTQYAAGALFRWVDHGFGTVKSCEPKLKQHLANEGHSRLRAALDLFTTLDQHIDLVREKGGSI